MLGGVRRSSPWLLGLACLPTALVGQAPPPVIDMHLHAVPIDGNGPPPVTICAPFDAYPARDPAVPAIQFFATEMVGPNAPCDRRLVSPATQDELIAQTIEAIERHNVIGVTSGSPELVDRHVSASDRVIPALLIALGTPEAPSVETVRDWFESGRFKVLGEVTSQYAGISLSDPAVEPYLAMAEELDIPVAVHVGPGPPGVGYFPGGRYKTTLSSALHLEEALLRHPRLRVYAMHAGFPLADDMIAMLYAHPQLYVDLGVISFTQSDAAFYGHLRRLVDAGFISRVMFGSDQMQWPDAIAIGIERIQNAPFLSEQQKRDILFNNAARFLRLDAEALVP